MDTTCFIHEKNTQKASSCARNEFNCIRCSIERITLSNLLNSSASERYSEVEWLAVVAYFRKPFSALRAEQQPCRIFGAVIPQILSTAATATVFITHVILQCHFSPGPGCVFVVAVCKRAVPAPTPQNIQRVRQVSRRQANLASTDSGEGCGRFFVGPSFHTPCMRALKLVLMRPPAFRHLIGHTQILSLRKSPRRYLLRDGTVLEGKLDPTCDTWTADFSYVYQNLIRPYVIYKIYKVHVTCLAIFDT